MSNWNINSQKLEQATRKGMASQPKTGTERTTWVMRQGPVTTTTKATDRRETQSSERGVGGWRTGAKRYKDPERNHTGKECLSHTVYSTRFFGVPKIKNQGRGSSTQRIHLGLFSLVPKRPWSIHSQAWVDYAGASWQKCLRGFDGNGRRKKRSSLWYLTSNRRGITRVAGVDIITLGKTIRASIRILQTSHLGPNLNLAI